MDDEAILEYFAGRETDSKNSEPKTVRGLCWSWSPRYLIQNCFSLWLKQKKQKTAVQKEQQVKSNPSPNVEVDQPVHGFDEFAKLTEASTSNVELVFK